VRSAAAIAASPAVRPQVKARAHKPIARAAA
jgi:hypothetical protein